jgi:CDP-paratose 2-epimerase
MKILVTGGCGFLGSNLAQYAYSKGNKVAVLDNLRRDGSRSNLEWLRKNASFQYFYGDTRSFEEVFSLVKEFKPDAIFHLAGQVAMTTSIASPRTDFEINALGTLNILEAVRKYAPTAAVLYSSTNKVYGDLEQFSYRETKTRYVCNEKPNGFAEDVPLNFHSPYGCSKGSADQYMLDYARIFGLNTIVFRHSSMYGGRQFATYDQGWIGWFCQKAVEQKTGEKEKFTISGNGKQVRDVLHVEDMQRLYFAALDNIDKGKGEAFNIGGAKANSLSLLELFELLERKVGVKLSYTKLPPRESDQRVFIADISKAKKLLHWTPEITADIGVNKMLNWVREIS